MHRIVAIPLLTLGIAACQDVTPPTLDHTPTFAITAQGNPFVGSWENTDVDGSHQHLKIGGGPRMPVHWRDDAGSICVAFGLGFVPATIAGFGMITSTSPWTFEFTGDIYCYARGPGGRQLVIAGVTIALNYNPESDTLGSPEFCWYRTSRPESCA